MNHTFHCHLSKSFHWYKNWHTHPHHQHAHWSIFSIIVFFVFSFISGSINPTSQFYTEQNIAKAQATLTLGISGNKFTFNGSQQFLLFISYFDAMNASDAILDSDFSQLRSLGFNGVRILPNWFPQPANQLMDASGNLRPGMLSRLINIIQKAQNNNLAVDVTFCRECISGLSVAGYKNGIVSTAQGLTAYRNLYFDIQNEADHPNNDRISATEARQIRDAVKAVDPQRIVSVSLISDSGNEQAFVINGAMDFHPAHGPFSTLSGTRTFVSGELAAVPGLPVHMQEPDRCRSNPCAYSTSAFITSATDAKCSGAAGWNFHTRAGYNLTTNTLFNQWLDPNIENGVANGLAGALASTTSNSCSGGSIPPPPPSGGPPPPPPGPSASGPPPYGCYQGSCPSGYISIADANASFADPAETSGWYCDDDQGQYGIQVTFPVQAIVACSGSGTGFVAPGSQWPCNAGRPGNPGWSFGGSSGGTPTTPDPTLSCGQNGGNQCGGSCPAGTTTDMSGTTWDCDPCLKCTAGSSSGSPTKNGAPVSFIATTSCPGTSSPFTLNNDDITTGAYTTSPSTEGNLCIRGTLLPASDPLCGGSPPPPPGGQPPPSLPSRYLLFAVPDFAPAGTTIILSGDNLGSTIEFIAPSGAVTTIAGVLGLYKKEVTIILPYNLAPSNYRVRIADTPASNEILFRVTPGLSAPGATGTESPIITSIDPLTIYPGGTLDIIGEFLSPDVQFTNTNGQSSYATGTISEDLRIVNVIIPNGLPVGVYTVSIINPNGITTALDVITVIEDQNLIGPSAQAIETPTATKFEDLISGSFNYAIMLVGIAVFIMILWAGFLWLTSGANPGNIATAKGYIFNAIMGAVLLLSAYVILYTINPQLVGGEFNLKGIPVPPPIQVPPPPDNGNVNPNIGCGSNQQFAEDLITDLGINNFSVSAGCGGNNHAQQNIMDMAAGLCPSVCADQCTPACTAGGPTGDITVDPEILEALSNLRTGRGIMFTVTSFTTGDHSLTSYHYSGRAVDIVPTSSDIGTWSETKLFLNSIGGTAICEVAGTVIPKCDDFSSGAHIHWQK